MNCPEDSPPISNHRLWKGTLALVTLALAGALGLIIALALGWNAPRSSRPPDWRASELPLDLKATRGETVVKLLGRPGRDFEDFTLEVEAVPLSGPESGFNGYGLVYRAQDAAHYYAFAVGSDGYYGILLVLGDEEHTLTEWQQFPHVRRGRGSNRLHVRCAGPVCRFYVNDEYATSVEDDTWLAGDVGLWVRDFGSGSVTVRFLDGYAWVER
ncbi:MAG: hypothetical protein DRI48_01005 [Chloroflexi bacterium]|nr:MAG: hypothetical protein DRI48_01005 [Chloroflexota bacterium]